MAKIQSFGTKTKLKNNEGLTFGREVETRVEEGGAETFNVEEAFATYSAALDDFDASIVDVRKSTLTQEMTQADADRDNIYVGTVEQINTGTRHFDPTKKAAALRLKPIADTYIGGQKRSFDDQTGFTTNFVQALRADANKADVTALGLGEWITQLEAANKRCSDLSVARSAQEATRAPKGSSTTTRHAFEKAYDALVERFNALALVNGDSAYLDLFGWWNARIDHYRRVLDQNLGAGAGGQTGGGTAKPTPKPDDEEDPNDRPDII